MTAADRAKRDAEIAALAPEDKPAEDAKTEVEIERTGFMDPDVRRGIPCFDGKHGLPGGAAVEGTRPGGELGAAARLEKQMRQEARDLNGKAREIVRSDLRRTRIKDHRDKDAT